MYRHSENKRKCKYERYEMLHANIDTYLTLNLNPLQRSDMNNSTSITKIYKYSKIHINFHLNLKKL